MVSIKFRYGSFFFLVFVVRLVCIDVGVGVYLIVMFYCYVVKWVCSVIVVWIGVLCGVGNFVGCDGDDCEM